MGIWLLFNCNPTLITANHFKNEKFKDDHYKFCCFDGIYKHHQLQTKQQRNH